MLMANRKSAKEVQSDFARDLGYQNVVWDLFTRNQKHELEEKLKTTYPDPDSERVNNEISRLQSKDERELFRKKVEKEKTRIKKCRDSVLEALWNQRKYNNRNLLMSTVFVLVTNPEISNHDALEAKDFSCFPLFRIRKCRVEEDTSECCMLFIDDAARVYQDWSDYLENNILPEGKMIVPEVGIYAFDDLGNVLLSVHETAALKYRRLQIADSSAGYAGMTAAAVTLGSLALPVAAPVIGVAAAVGVAAAGWSTVRSVFQLRDRSTHEQSTSLDDREARGHWLGVAGGVMGLGAMGATFSMAKHAAAGGNVSAFVKATVNGLNASALIINGVSVGNGFFEIYLKAEDDEPISRLELVQLGASIFLFTHSVYNFQTAAKIVDSTRNGTISQFRQELSKRQRKMFDKMAKETVRIRGSDQGKIDIIRGLRNIPDNKYFNDVYKVNRQLNENNVRPSFGHDGNVVLNNEISVDSASLRNNLQHGIGEPIINRAGAIPPTHADGRPGNFFGNISVNSATRMLRVVLNGVNACRISQVTDIQNLILNILSKFSQEILQTLIDIADKFILDCLPEIVNTVRRYIDYEEVLQKTFAISLQLTGGNPKIMTEHYLKTQTNNILQRLKQFFLDSNPTTTEGRNKCEKCRGYYYIRF